MSDEARMVNFRCPADLRKKIQARADREKRKLSDWIRLALSREVERVGKTMFDRRGGRG